MSNRLKKNPPAPPPEILSEAAGVRPAAGATHATHATAAQLAIALGLPDLDDAFLRNHHKDGIPKPVKSKYPINDTILALLKYYHAKTAEKKSGAEEIFPSMEAFSRASGISPAMLREMKADKCPGFHASGRIHLFEFLGGLETWLAGDNQHDKQELLREGVNSWTNLREKYQGKSEKLKHDELNGGLMDADTALDCGLAAQAVYFGMLDRLAVDFPGRLAGRKAAEIKTEVDKTLKKIREAVQKEFAARLKKSDAQLEAQRKADEAVKP